jgi:hypothetical protein
MADTVAALQDTIQALRDAVAARLSATPPDDPKMTGYSPMAASLAGCPPAQAAAAACLSCPTPEPEPDPEYILRGQAELETHVPSETPPSCGSGWVPAGSYKSLLESLEKLRRARPEPNVLRPGSREFVAILDELRQLHLAKTLDYGVDDDALSNIRTSADVLNVPAWAGCVLRISDKMHRLKAYFRRGKVEFDGLSDTLMDIAAYAVIAEVLRREEQRP